MSKQKCTCCGWQKSLRKNTGPVFYKSDLEKTRSRAHSLKQKLCICSEENEMLMSTNEEMHMAVADKERKLHYVEQQNKEMLQRLSQAQQVNASIYERAESTTSSLQAQLSASEAALQQANAQIEMMEARHNIAEKKLGEMQGRLDEVRRERDAWKSRAAQQDRNHQDLQLALDQATEQLASREADEAARATEWNTRLESEIRLREQAEAQERSMARKARHLEHEVALVGSQRAALESSLQTKCELDWPYRKVVSAKPSSSRCDGGRRAKTSNLPFSDLYMGF